MSLVLGLGVGLPCVFAIRHVARTGQLWTFMGSPTYGHRPFERIGIETSVPLLVGFLAVCVPTAKVPAPRGGWGHGVAGHLNVDAPVPEAPIAQHVRTRWSPGSMAPHQ